jgi:hypothetical protein
VTAAPGFLPKELKTMAINKNKKQQELGSVEKPQVKRPGTRMSMVEDWRIAGAQSSNNKSKRGETLRDGR